LPDERRTAMARKIETRRERQEMRNLARAIVELKLGHAIYEATERSSREEREEKGGGKNYRARGDNDDRSWHDSRKPKFASRNSLDSEASCGIYRFAASDGGDV